MRINQKLLKAQHVYVHRDVRIWMESVAKQVTVEMVRKFPGNWEALLAKDKPALTYTCECGEKIEAAL